MTQTVARFALTVLVAPSIAPAQSSLEWEVLAAERSPISAWSLS